MPDLVTRPTNDTLVWPGVNRNAGVTRRGYRQAGAASRLERGKACKMRAEPGVGSRSPTAPQEFVMMRVDQPRVQRPWHDMPSYPLGKRGSQPPWAGALYFGSRLFLETDETSGAFVRKGIGGAHPPAQAQSRSGSGLEMPTEGASRIGECHRGLTNLDCGTWLLDGTLPPSSRGFR